jgi:hypothetical protein
VTAAVLSLGVLWGPVRQMAEDAALRLLFPLHKLAGGYLEALDPYNGELDSDEGLELLYKQAIGGAPLVLVGAQDSAFQRQGGTSRRRYREDVQIEIVIASSNLRGFPGRSRTGPGAGPQRDDHAIPTDDPGVYRILEDVRRALLGAKLWIDGADATELAREEPVFSIPRVTVWRAHYRVGVAFDAEYFEGNHRALTARGSFNLDGAVGRNPIVVADSP